MEELAGIFAVDVLGFSVKRGAMPADLRPILERLAINAETWLDSITCFGRWFHRAVGRMSGRP